MNGTNSLKIGLLVCFGVFGIFAGASAVITPVQLHFGTAVIDGQKAIAITLSINPFGSVVNAIEGEIAVPSGLQLSHIEIDETIIGAWITYPAVGDDGVLRYAGIMPSGYAGTYGPYERTPGAGVVFTARFDLIEPRQAQLHVRSAEVLLHDGLGTVAPLSLSADTAYVDTSSITRRSAQGDSRTGDWWTAALAGLLLILYGFWRLKR